MISGGREDAYEKSALSRLQLNGYSPTLPSKTSPGLTLVFGESGLKGGQADESEVTQPGADTVYGL